MEKNIALIFTNAIRQRTTGVVLPEDIFSTSRAVSPFFPSVQAVKGSSRRASVFHRSLKQENFTFSIRNYDDTCMIMPLSQSIVAPVEVPKSGPLGSHLFAAKVPDVTVKYWFAYVRNV